MMVATATDTTSYLAALSDTAFEAFCDDIAGMFGAEIRCERRQAGLGPLPNLREQFKKLTVVHQIQAEGTLHGTFPVLFDQGGVFVLSGVIVMLPEARIREAIKRGSLQDAENLQDAARETGNLLVGSWDRVFRQDCAGHKHFLKTGTFIGKPWENHSPPDFPTEGEALIILYDMTVDPYPSFRCAAVFPKAILESLGRMRAEQAPEEITPEEPPGNDPPAKKSASPVTQAPAASPSPEVHPPSPTAPEKPAAPSNTKPPDRAPAREEPAAPAPQPQVQHAPQAAAVEPVEPSDRMAGGPTSAPLPLPSCDAAAAEWLRVPVARIMQKNVVWAGPDETVQDVIARMQQQNVGYVLIGQNGVLEGLVSNSNILGAVSVYLRPMFAKWRRSEDDATLGVKVRWIMSRPVRTIRPDTTVAATIESMRRCGGRCLPVVDAQGAVQGIVTVFDLLLRLLEVEGSNVWQGQPPQAPALLL